MNKRLIAVFCIVVGLVIVAMGSVLLLARDEGVGETTTKKQEETKVEETASKALIVVFSRAGENYGVGKVAVGNTERMANVIKETTGAAMFKIEPTNPYPEGYEETKAIVQQERTENARPAYVGDVEGWAEYDTVYLGYPIWWGDLPQIVYTFIENHDWRGKTVIPFNTHEGSGSAGTYETLKAKLVGANVKDGLAIAGSQVDGATEEIREFVQGK